MKRKVLILAVLIAWVGTGLGVAAVEKIIELPLGTQAEQPGAGQVILTLPDGQRLELGGGAGVTQGFPRCVLRNPQGKVLLQGMQAHFVQPSVEKVVVLPASVRLVAIDGELLWARQGAPVPGGSYIRIDDEVVWLPAKLSFVILPQRPKVSPGLGHPEVQPR